MIRDYIFWISIFTMISGMITAIATFLSFRLQKENQKAKVIFDLIREGERIIPELSNIGCEVARNITITTNPPLVVADEIDKNYEGDRSLLTPNMVANGVQTLLPKKVMREYGFSAKAFRNQFVNFRTIVVKITYFSGNSVCTDMWHIDLSHLTYFKEPGYY